MKNLAILLLSLITVLTVNAQEFVIEDQSNYKWVKRSNVGQYKGANWDNLVKRVSNVSVDEAKEIADQDPNISYFFIMKTSMFLEGKFGIHGWTEKGYFAPNEAVFFTGRPWYGSAPMADAYEKEFEQLIVIQDINITASVNNHNNLDDYIKVNVYPNPSRGNVGVKVFNEEPFHVEVFSMNGQMVYQTDFLQEANAQMDLSDMPKGIYHVRVSQGNSAIMKKLILQ